jgi:GNAT superfamily N-acetyltransferase
MIRRVGADEADQLRDLRLRALRDAPYAFWATHDAESAFPPSRWTDLAESASASAEAAVFVAIDHDQWVGMAGAMRQGEGDSVFVWGMWVAPTSRGNGLGRRLVEAAISWARANGASRVELSVSDSPLATAATALYGSMGFTATGLCEDMPADPTLSCSQLVLVL